ncbi:MAG: endonuclease/exonuclease/phosphatase family protein [Desulfobacteraceae bacterium]|nr:endonuclease/exonuclease/phosphatase family protein [Desulfobacteraceae bacterium]
MNTKNKNPSLFDKITDPPPSEIEAELRELRAALDREIPSKKLDDNLLIATWNLRAFGGLTKKWKSTKNDSPKRNLHALCCISEIVSRFDVIALQEVRGKLRALRHMLTALGPHWALLLTDVTKGSAGNDERMAFVFDTRKVKSSGLACELVVPVDRNKDITPDAFNRQFARTPYAASFISAGRTFILVSLHVLYGEKPENRLPELKAIAEWLADWAKYENSFDHNIIALGDFNIDRVRDPLYEAFTSTGLHTPPELDDVPRTIFGKPGDHQTKKHYDQVAWFTSGKGIPRLSLVFSSAGSFDFAKVVMKSLSKTQLSWRISDHYPLWVEFLVRKD